MKYYVKLIQSILIVLIVCASTCSRSKQNQPQPIPKPHESHLGPEWYSNKPAILSKQVDDYLNIARKEFPVDIDPKTIKAIIVPHASHFYSGLCAATAYQSICGEGAPNKQINHVLILAPSHHTFSPWVALPDYNEYATPLGTIKVNDEALKKLSKKEHFQVFETAHEKEHSLEVQLPFLQKTIESFTITPLIVGHLNGISQITQIAKTLKEIISPSTLVVVSSDFMHYGSTFQYTPFSNNIWHNIRSTDSQALHAITSGSLQEFDAIVRHTHTTICGQHPLRLLIALLGLKAIECSQAHVTCYYTSPQITKAHTENSLNPSLLFDAVSDDECSSSVSYVGALFSSEKLSEMPKEAQLTGFEKKALLHAARDAIANEFKGDKKRIPELVWPLVTPGNNRSGGAFVTINTKQSALRGCIGRIMSSEPLFKTVVDMSIQAAFHDNRFTPLTENELENIIFEITLLTKPQPTQNLNNIILGTHGIILKKVDKAGRMIASAVFLPHVPLSFGWNLDQTLEQLSIKAGLARDAWKQDTQYDIFEGVELHE